MSDNKNHQLKDKKAQVGETVTWVTATIIIVVVLLASIYASSMLAEAKKIIPYKEYERENDLIMEKTILAYYSIDDEAKKEIIYEYLESQEFYAGFRQKFNEVEDNLR